MRLALAILYSVVGVAIFIYAFITEWKQSRADGPVAIVATLPFAVPSSFCLSFALAVAPLGVPWWAAFSSFPVLVVTFGKLILMADAKHR